MSFSLQPPSVVATLPSPLDKKHGRIQAAPCFGLRESKKRKRHEVAVAVDGEGLNLYNVQHQTLIASYPLPSQTYHKCAPCSVVYKKGLSQQPSRHSIAVIQDGRLGTKCRILNFVQPLEQDKSGPLQQAPSARKEKALQRCDVLSIEAVSNESNELVIIVFYSSGHIEVLSSDLTEAHLYRTSSLDSSQLRVYFATSVDLGSAQKGLFKDRTDVPRTGYALCQVFQKQRARVVRVISLPLRPSQFGSDLLPPIWQYNLPGTADWNASSPTFELHTSSGRLYELAHGRIHIYDLVSLVPRIVCELSSTSSLYSFTRLSANLVLALSANEAIVYETTFGTTTAITEISGEEESKERRKRKRPSDAEHYFGSVVAGFPQVDTVIILSAEQILALQTSLPSDAGRRSKPGKTLIAEVLANDSTAPNTLRPNDMESSAPSDWTDELERHIETGLVEPLELFVADTFQIKLDKDDSGKRLPDLWDFQSVKSVQFSGSKTVQLIRSIFKSTGLSEEQTSSGILRLRIPAKNILTWLAIAGVLDVKHLREAFGQSCSPDSIIPILEAADNGFEILYSLFASPATLDLADVIRTLKAVIRSLEVPESTKQSGTRQTNDPDINSQADADTANHKEEKSLEIASRRAETELQHAVQALSSGLEIRSEVLRLAFTRLISYSSSAISQTMRLMMDQREIIFLVHLLRLELADGGWTSRYIYNATTLDGDEVGLLGTLRSDEDATGPLNQAIEAISILLNCAIDALGISGWLVGQSGRLGMEDMIDSLRAEVSAVLEGCYEAKSLGILLQDLEKYGYQKKESGKAIRAAIKKKKWTDLASSKHDVVKEPALPLGCTVETPIFHGREGKKIMDTLEGARNRAIGQYEIDRIRI
ncbi:hypothetical protein K431DRAFT_347675 [Polychaeton citri CBS 116435]|uniref:Utp8 beta-propeller domain-containing protein n=1 Tax=Polychaeton citri CBS 116435 TaxID=1314669 RepID=A0A9P4Q7A2_9PEZI|nr:hypothetical protein K431DRAFT_347675 [Polychaeton citri CBS 116435]